MKRWSVGVPSNSEAHGSRGIRTKRPQNQLISSSPLLHCCITRPLDHCILLVSFQDTHRLVSDALCSSNGSQRSFASHFGWSDDSLCFGDDCFRISLDHCRLLHLPPCSCIDCLYSIGDRRRRILDPLFDSQICQSPTGARKS